jgi:hypothetical protein
MKNTHCPICGSDSHEADPYNSNISVCPICTPMSQRAQYDLIQTRIDGSITAAQTLVNEAYRAGDMETVSEVQVHIETMKRQKEELRKP